MRSLVNWALLGLVIERPSYAYELARRFERRRMLIS
jgi:DNA-binding PadR family transcriptional regulator